MFGGSSLKSLGHFSINIWVFRSTTVKFSVRPLQPLHQFLPAGWANQNTHSFLSTHLSIRGLNGSCGSVCFWDKKRVRASKQVVSFWWNLGEHGLLLWFVHSQWINLHVRTLFIEHVVIGLTQTYSSLFLVLISLHTSIRSHHKLYVHRSLI